jgi:hypothetical protein
MSVWRNFFYTVNLARREIVIFLVFLMSLRADTLSSMNDLCWRGAFGDSAQRKAATTAAPISRQPTRFAPDCAMSAVR